MTYLSEVLADAPVHYWRFADPGGSLAHDIGSSPMALGFAPVTPNVLSYSGISTTGGSVWVDSGFGWLNGEASAVASPMSVECWVWPISNLGVLRWFIDFGGTAGFGLDLVETVRNQLAADWAGAHVEDTTILTDRAWSHCVATEDGANVRLYRNGALVGTTVALAGAGGNAAINVGRSNTGGAFSAGAMCEVAIYGAALSGARIAAHYAAREISGPPVFNGSGLAALLGSSGSLDDSILTTILKSVRKQY